MAILIDMDMPDTCGNCIFGIDRKRCPILWRDFSGNPNMRYKDCPLREVYTKQEIMHSRVCDSCKDVNTFIYDEPCKSCLVYYLDYTNCTKMRNKDEQVKKD